MAAHPRIALIHATPVAIDPIRQSFAAGWSEAEIVNILDDSLSPDRATAGEISDELAGRILDLARYARRTGANAILFTCSAFGSAIERAGMLLDVPVLKPNEAMFEKAIELGSNIAMIATFAPARASMEVEFSEEVARRHADARLTTVVSEAAMAALKAGDAETHNRLVAEAAGKMPGYDAIMLAHFSTSRAGAAASAATRIPVLTSPDAAVEKLRRMVTA